jgi:hypothetical protein
MKYGVKFIPAEPFNKVAANKSFITFSHYHVVQKSNLSSSLLIMMW